jgi:hypothetical protein
VSGPGDPALPLLRPVALGWRLASMRPGDVIVEPPLLVPGEVGGEALGLAAAAAAC